MTEIEDLDLLVRAIDDAQNCLRSHIELGNGDASSIVVNVSATLSRPKLAQAIERVRLRMLTKALAGGENI